MELKIVSKEIAIQLKKLGFDWALGLSTQALIVKWFRDVHNIVINVEKDANQEWFNFIEYNWRDSVCDTTTDSIIYSNYEAAEEAGIIQAIQILNER